jgi:chromosome segregation protein
MYLRRIELYGFKSFAHEVVLELSPGITALVGPNGGGKSNVVDAVRWVLGEQRIRELRAERWEELLFAGSPGRRPAQVTEAFLEFDNTDGAMSEWPEVLRVGRRLYRHGESEYLIGSRVVRLKDVTDLFLDSGLGRAAYAIIGQGRVEQTLLQRPHERLEQLEEAAGTTRYKVRRRETAQQLEAVRRQLTRVADVERQVQLEQDQVADAAQREERYRGLEAERRRLLAQIRAVRRTFWQQEAGRAEAARAAAEAAWEQAEAARRAAEGALEEATADHGQAAARYAEAEAAVRVCRQAVEQAKRDAARWEERALAAQRRAAEARALLAAESEVPDAEPLPDDDDATEEANAFGATLLQRVNAVEERLHDLEARLKSRRAELSLRERQWEDRLRLEAELARVDASAASPLQVGDQLRQAVENAEETLARIESAHQETVHQRDQLRRYLNEQQTQLRVAEQHYTQRQARHRALQQLEAEGEGYAAGVRAVLRAQAEGQLRGIHGTLASLIETDDAYGVALQAALGGAGQDLVADSERSARTAIRYLQSRGLGRATFLPLDTVRAARPLPDDRDLVRQAGVVGWAIDLVRTADAFRVAAAHALGRVLVVESLEDAVAVGRLIAFRYRLVTLDGQLIHPGGAMTGGTPAQPGAWLRRQDIDRLARELAGEWERLEGLRELVAGVEGELAACEARLAALAADRAEARTRLTLAQERWRSVEPLLSAQDWGVDRETLANGLAEARRELGLAETAWDNARAEWQAARDELLRFQAQQEAAARQREERTAMRRRLVLERERQAARRAEATHRLQTVEAEWAEMSAGLSRAQEAAAQAEADLAAAESAAGECRQVLEAAERRREEARAVLRRLDGEARRQSGELLRRQTALQHIAAELARWSDGEEDAGTEADEAADLPPEEEWEPRLQQVEQELEALGPIQPGSLALYQRLSERRAHLQREREDIEAAVRELETTLAQLDASAEALRRETASRVEDLLQDTVRDLFGGGSARFRWVSDPEEGLELLIEPPGKRPQSLQSLSGGEKAMGALAWLFALLAIRPAPLVVLDEVEASLDELNARRFAQHLARRRHTQYLVVTHHKPTMEQADALWGFSADAHGISRLVSVRLDEEVTG